MIVTQQKGKFWAVRLQVPEARISYRTAMRWWGLCRWLEGMGDANNEGNRGQFYIQVRALGSEAQPSTDSPQVACIGRFSSQCNKKQQKVINTYLGSHVTGNSSSWG